MKTRQVDNEWRLIKSKIRVLRNRYRRFFIFFIRLLLIAVLSSTILRTIRGVTQYDWVTWWKQEKRRRFSGRTRIAWTTTYHHTSSAYIMGSPHEIRLSSLLAENSLVLGPETTDLKRVLVVVDESLAAEDLANVTRLFADRATVKCIYAQDIGKGMCSSLGNLSFPCSGTVIGL